jgi:HK97 family phage major capsid protein
MKYARIIAEVLNIPWAILDAKFDAIATVLARCEAGETLTEEEIRARVGEKKLQGEPYCFAEGERLSFSASSGSAKPAPKLTAVIPVFGILVNRVASLDISETGTGVDRLQQMFRQALANPDVKAVVLDFDSPGGSVYGIDEFAQEIFDARGQKKIVAQIDPLAASAAYYLASQAEEIVITPSGEAGSIGVRAMHQDLSKALEARGVKITHISAGKYKTEGNPTEPLSDDARAFMQQRVNEYYDAFVKAVARGRDVKASDVRNGFGEGRVVGASEAKRLGMVDRVATLDETLSRLGASVNSARVPMATAYAEAEKIAARVTAAAASLDVSGEVIDVLNTTATAEEKQLEVVMSTTTTAAAAAASNVDTILAAEATRIDRLNQLATAHNMVSKLGDWIRNKTSVSDVQSEILSSLNPAPLPQPAAERFSGGIQVVRDEADKVEKGVRVGRMLRAIAGAHREQKRGNMGMSAQKFALTILRDKVVADLLDSSRYEAAANPQDASSLAGGGFMIPDNLATEVVELLRPMAVVRSLNPATAPLVNGQLTLPKLTGGVTASYMGENKPITPSKVTGGQVKATAKKLAALVPISNDLLRFASQSADEMVRNDMVRAVAQVEDISFIRAAGTAYSPKGLKYWTPAANVVNSNATISVANTLGDLGALWKLLANAYVKFIRPGFIFSPRTYQYFFNLISANAVYIFRDEMLAKGTINGVPFRWTPQIPENLNVVGGRGSIESEIYFADFADVVICDAPVLSVEISTEATYDDGSGNLTSAFSNDQTVIRMIVEHDLIVRHQESLTYLQGVNWV